MQPTTNNTTTQPTTLPNTGGVDTNLLMKALQDQLLSSSGMVTSGTSEIETRFNNAIESIKTGKEAGNEKLQSEFERNANYLGEKFNADQLSGREQQSGGLQAFGALKALTESTDKSLKDLAMRKEELVLANNVAAANKITDLEIQAIEYREKARQQVFNNILSLGNFSETVKAGQREEKAQTFREKQTMSEIALKYGVSVNAGDTIESVVTKAMPTASAQAKAELAKTLAETRRINSEITKLQQGDKTASVDSSVLDSVAYSLLDLEASGDTAGISAILSGVENKGGFQALTYLKDKQIKIKEQRFKESQATEKAQLNEMKKTQIKKGGFNTKASSQIKLNDVTSFFNTGGGFKI